MLPINVRSLPRYVAYKRTNETRFKRIQRSKKGRYRGRTLKRILEELESLGCTVKLAPTRSVVTWVSSNY